MAQLLFCCDDDPGATSSSSASWSLIVRAEMRWMARTGRWAGQIDKVFEDYQY